MDESQLRHLLERVRSGDLDVDRAMQHLLDLPYSELGYAKLDHHRSLRTGFPEVVFAEGKSTDQILGILNRLTVAHETTVVTRASEELYRAVKAWDDRARYHSRARIISIRAGNEPSPGVRGRVTVVTAGTADLPVAEEAAVTLELMGSPVDRLYDVGVAGIHRLFGSLRTLRRSVAIIAVAGMEGALPSVIAGLVGVPVIAVPTSIGYGASLNGFAALLTMLNSCAPGLSVVNVDNGFGAACSAHLINLERPPASPRLERSGGPGRTKGPKGDDRR